MNIIVKSFDGNVFERQQIENALRGMSIGTCITISNAPEWTPELTAAQHVWVNAKKQRIGDYAGFDWNDVTPLDADLIEKMRGCEAIFLKMVGRYVQSMPRWRVLNDIPFRERHRQYYAHLQYWNHMLITHKINLVLMNHEPHQCYDYVLYELCRLKKIPIFYINRTYTIGAAFITRDMEDPSPELHQIYQKLQKNFVDPSGTVPLSENYEKIFHFFRNPRPVPPYTPKLDRLQKRDAFSALLGRAIKVLVRHPARFVTSVCSQQFWARKKRERETIRLYDQLARDPDLSKPYVYIALHLQPEATTLPLAGAYEDQELMVQLIAAALPQGWCIYVKENPEQDERWRSPEFYRSLVSIPSVTLVPKKTDTFMLLDRAKAVVTATGTVAFEASLRLKPALMFGHFLWQYAPGVHQVRTLEDCKRVLQGIAQNPCQHTEHDARVFMKALEETATPYPGSRRSPVHTKYEEQKEREAEKAVLVGALLRRHTDAVMGA